MNEKQIADQILVVHLQTNSLDQYLETLRTQGWEITDIARKHLLRFCQPSLLSKQEQVYCTQFDQITWVLETGIRAIEIFRICDNPSPSDGRRKPNPCSPESVLGLCLHLGGKIENKRIYVCSRTTISGTVTNSLFLLTHTLNIPVLDLVDWDTVIQKSGRNILINA